MKETKPFPPVVLYDRIKTFSLTHSFQKKFFFSFLYLMIDFGDFVVSLITRDFNKHVGDRLTEIETLSNCVTTKLYYLSVLFPLLLNTSKRARFLPLKLNTLY